MKTYSQLAPKRQITEADETISLPDVTAFIQANQNNVGRQPVNLKGAKITNAIYLGNGSYAVKSGSTVALTVYQKLLGKLVTINLSADQARILGKM